jgi:hypothetical protein
MVDPLRNPSLDSSSRIDAEPHCTSCTNSFRAEYLGELAVAVDLRTTASDHFRSRAQRDAMKRMRDAPVDHDVRSRAARAGFDAREVVAIVSTAAAFALPPTSADSDMPRRI